MTDSDAERKPASPMQPNGPGARLQRLYKLFLSYHGTENEGPIRREQAMLLFGMTFFFAILGVGSCMLFTFAFEPHVAPGTALADEVIILLYVGLIASGLRWKRRNNDAGYIRASVLYLKFTGTGVALMH